MAKKQLPEKVPTPGTEDSLDVPISLDQTVTVTSEQADALMARQGLSSISSGSIKDLADLGIFISGTGITRIQKGRAFATQHRLDNILKQIEGQVIVEGTKKKPNINRMIALSRAAGYTASKLTESQRLLLEMSGSGGKKVVASQGEDELPQHTPFAPGEDIPIPGGTTIHAQNVQIVQGAQSPPAEKSIAS